MEGPVVKIRINVNGTWREDGVEPRLLLVHYLRDIAGLTGHPRGMRDLNLRSVHGPAERRSGEILYHIRGTGRWRGGRHHRGVGTQRQAPPAAGGILGGARSAVRVLHAHDSGRSPTPEP